MNTLNWMQSIVIGFVHWTCMPKCHTHRTQIFSPTCERKTIKQIFSPTWERKKIKQIFSPNCERKTINWMQSIVLWFANWTWMPKCCTSHRRYFKIFSHCQIASMATARFCPLKTEEEEIYLLSETIPKNTKYNTKWVVNVLLPGRIREWTKKCSWKHLEATALSQLMSRTCQSHSSTCLPTV